MSNYHVASPNAVPQTTSRPLARVRAINDWMREYAAAHQHQYVDYFSAMIDEAGLLRPELSADDLHPTAAGYAIMAPLAEAAIQRAMGEITICHAAIDSRKICHRDTETQRFRN